MHDFRNEHASCADKYESCSADVFMAEINFEFLIREIKYHFLFQFLYGNPQITRDVRNELLISIWRLQISS